MADPTEAGADTQWLANRRWREGAAQQRAKAWKVSELAAGPDGVVATPDVVRHKSDRRAAQRARAAAAAEQAAAAAAEQAAAAAEQAAASHAPKIPTQVRESAERILAAAAEQAAAAGAAPSPPPPLSPWPKTRPSMQRAAIPPPAEEVSVEAPAAEAATTPPAEEVSVEATPPWRQGSVEASAPKAVTTQVTPPWRRSYQARGCAAAVQQRQQQRQQQQQQQCRQAPLLLATLAVNVFSFDVSCCWRQCTANFDCAVFHDKRTDHDGRHRSVQDRILDKTDVFMEMAAWVKGFLTSQLEAGVSECDMGFFCKAGKHRSTACAEMFGAVIQSLLQHGWPIRLRSLEHVSLRTHSRGHRDCWECEGSRMSPEVRERALAMFMSAWSMRCGY